MESASTGIVRALRVVSASPSWWTAWAAAADAQWAIPFDARADDAGIEVLYRHFPHSREMVRHVVVTELTGQV